MEAIHNMQRIRVHLPHIVHLGNPSLSTTIHCAARQAPSQRCTGCRRALPRAGCSPTACTWALYYRNGSVSNGGGCLDGRGHRSILQVGKRREYYKGDMAISVIPAESKSFSWKRRYRCIWHLPCLPRSGLRYALLGVSLRSPNTTKLPQ